MKLIIYLVLFFSPLYMFGQEDKHEELRLKRHPLPETEVPRKYVLDILSDEDLVNKIARNILFSDYKDLTVRNVKKTYFKLYEDINVWQVCFVLGLEGNDTFYSKYYIRFNKNTVEVIDRWTEK